MHLLVCLFYSYTLVHLIHFFFFLCDRCVMYASLWIVQENRAGSCVQSSAFRLGLCPPPAFIPPSIALDLVQACNHLTAHKTTVTSRASALHTRLHSAH